MRAWWLVGWLAACGDKEPGAGGEDTEGGETIRDAGGDGFAASEGDCDDAGAQIHPNAAEVGDAIDNDCDG